MKLLLLASLSAAFLSACVLSPLDLDGKACPCAEGFTCDDERDVCVASTGARDGGAADAAADSGR